MFKYGDGEHGGIQFNVRLHKAIEVNEARWKEVEVVDGGV